MWIPFKNHLFTYISLATRPMSPMFPVFIQINTNQLENTWKYSNIQQTHLLNDVRAMWLSHSLTHSSTFCIRSVCIIHIYIPHHFNFMIFRWIFPFRLIFTIFDYFFFLWTIFVFQFWSTTIFSMHSNERENANMISN